MKKILNFNEQVEQSLQKKFRSTLWTPFVKAIKTYELIQEGDKIAVCISGGKDSMLMAKLMQQLQKYSIFPFTAEYLVMNPGYNSANLQQIKDNAQRLDIPITIFESDIFDTVANIQKNPCYLCARMRRGFLYAKAKELGCNKIALGHHFSDVVETILIGLFYGAQYQTMMPKLHSKNFEGMELIRPMYCIHEQSVLSWRDYFQLQFLQCACRFTEQLSQSEQAEQASKRLEVKKLLATLRQTDKDIEHRIFKSSHMVNLNTILGYKHNGKEHYFLNNYDNYQED